MAVTGLLGSWLWARERNGALTHSVTVQVRNRDVFAEIALYDIDVFDEENHSSLAHISQMVSDSGVENFPDGRPMAFRRNVTSITFRVVTINAKTAARWMIHFWS